MASLYIITGPAGVGKSTISTELATHLSKSVLIEGDSIYSQVINSYVSAWKEGNHLEVFWKICFDMIRTYLSYGYNVVFNYIITPSVLDKIKNNFKNYKIKFIVLLADEDTLLNRDKLRPENCQMHERCLILLNSFKNKNFDSKHILDTSNLSISETIEIIKNNNNFYINFITFS